MLVTGGQALEDEVAAEDRGYVTAPAEQQPESERYVTAPEEQQPEPERQESERCITAVNKIRARMVAILGIHMIAPIPALDFEIRSVYGIRTRFEIRSILASGGGGWVGGREGGRVRAYACVCP